MATSETMSLADAVGFERIQLMQIQAALHCLYESLLNGESDNSVIYADATKLAVRLLDDSIARLDVLRSRCARSQQPYPKSDFPVDEVRDRRGVYLCHTRGVVN